MPVWHFLNLLHAQIDTWQGREDYSFQLRSVSATVPSQTAFGNQPHGEVQSITGTIPDETSTMINNTILQGDIVASSNLEIQTNIMLSS